MAAMMQPAMINTSRGTAGRSVDVFMGEYPRGGYSIYARDIITESNIAE
jgi:hypothetical protein